MSISHAGTAGVGNVVLLGVFQPLCGSIGGFGEVVVVDRLNTYMCVAKAHPHPVGAANKCLSFLWDVLKRPAAGAFDQCG